MDPTVWMMPIGLAPYVKEREKLLIEDENAMFEAARDRATTDEERVYWDEFIKLREKNANQRVRPADGGP